MTKEIQNSKPGKFKSQALFNSLLAFTMGVIGINGQTNTINTEYTIIKNLRGYPISMQRQWLDLLYSEFALVQTFIDLPVDDAFRGGIKIKCDQLSSDEVEELNTYIDRNNILKEVTDALKWMRLFGGSGIIINVPQAFDEELDIDQIDDDTELEFYAADRWELQQTRAAGRSGDNMFGQLPDCPYQYYGHRLHKSRVIRLEGKRAPSITALKLQGWGLSEVEGIIRALNTHTKAIDVIFEILDEAKVDVYKISGFNDSMLAGDRASQAVQERVTLANKLKSFLNALIMDSEDSFEQKQMSFVGLAEMLKESRISLASELRIPMTKLFGLSASGFNSGEDDIENYNAMVETEIRSKCKHILIDILRLVIKKLFGIVPERIDVEFESLRVLSSLDEENIKNTKFDRLVRVYEAGIIDEDQYKEALNTNNLLEYSLG